MNFSKFGGSHCGRSGFREKYSKDNGSEGVVCPVISFIDLIIVYGENGLHLFQTSDALILR